MPVKGELIYRRPDQYHTCNNLSGLSVAQHNVVHSPALVEENRKKFDPSKGFPAVTPTNPEGGWASEEERQEVRRQVWASALGWVEEGEAIILGGKESRVVSSLLGRLCVVQVADSAEHNRTGLEYPPITFETVHQLLLWSDCLSSTYFRSISLNLVHHASLCHLPYLANTRSSTPSPTHLYTPSANARFSASAR